MPLEFEAPQPVNTKETPPMETLHFRVFSISVHKSCMQSQVVWSQALHFLLNYKNNLTFVQKLECLYLCQIANSPNKAYIHPCKTQQLPALKKTKQNTCNRKTEINYHFFFLPDNCI